MVLMDNRWKKITLIILFVILIPALIVTVYELSSLNDSAEQFQEAYARQLDAILFSVNLYSEDVLSKWIDDIESAYLSESNSAVFKNTKTILSNNSLFDIMIVFRGTSGKIKNILYDESVIDLSITHQFLEDTWRLGSLVENNSSKLKKLLEYKQNSFTKIEPIDFEEPEFIDLSSNQNISKIAFMIGTPESGYDLVVLSIDEEEFLKNVIIPKIESIEQNKLEMLITHDSLEKVIYSSTGKMTEKVLQKKNIWILPKYSLGISQSGLSITDVVEDRREINLFIVIFFDFCLIVALWIIARYLKKEAILSRQKSDFVSNVSHELRTPLSLIKMYTESLEMGRVKDELKRMEYFSVINNETDKLASTLNKILNFSRMDAGKRKFSLALTNINDLVEKVVSLYEYQLREREFEFTFTGCSESCEIPVDEKAVEEALSNLIDNAIKYSRENKSIAVKTFKKNQNMVIEVEDKGIGIPEADQKRIFEKFFRVSTGLVHDTKGSGLGLSLVKHIMAGHGGDVFVESKFGKGSKFTLVFPFDNKNGNN